MLLKIYKKKPSKQYTGYNLLSEPKYNQLNHLHDFSTGRTYMYTDFDEDDRLKT